MSQVARSVVIVLNKLEAQCFPKGCDIKSLTHTFDDDCTTELLKTAFGRFFRDFCSIISLCLLSLLT